MELALNLLWIMLAAVLCASCVWSCQRGDLRLPLHSALGCCVLLAILLFPAISMSDDMQRASVLLGNRVAVCALEGTSPLTVLVELVPMLLLALLFAGVMVRSLHWLLDLRVVRAQVGLLVAPAMRVRPPTLAAAAPAGL